MFISTGYLGIQYGVDNKIAKFFVDREPPPNNLYWRDKYLYLSPSPGYLFIPLIADLLFKLGINRQELLSDEFIHCLEQTGHIGALEETKQISKAQAIENCTAVARENCRNEDWLNHVIDYFNGTPDNLFMGIATPFKALHRGDVFLFSLSALDFPNELFQKIAQYWFALISTLLLLDDAEDIDDDKANNEENAFLESGLDKEGIERVKQLVAHNLRMIASINSMMSMKLDNQFKELIKKPYISPLINQ
jgi:hypothetical protein